MNCKQVKDTVLIVDDIVSNIGMVAEALEPDYELLFATNGEDAIRSATSEHPPDLILLDIMMPEMDGYEVCRRLKEHEVSRNIPIIFVTAKGEEQEETEGLELGAVDYITKPFSLPIVKARVKAHLERKRAEEAIIRLERLKAVAELASGVAHHFNNMLQIVMGNAQMGLIDLELGDLRNVKNRFDGILESSRFGAATVRRLQSFVRLRSGEAGPGRTFDLADTVRQAVEATRLWWKTEPDKNGIDINLIPVLSRDCSVNGREDEMFEVVAHLIRNAVEALPEGGEIVIKTSAQDDQVMLCVEDTGVGILPEYLDKLFDPFFSTKGVHRTGMGLASSFGIVKNHGGTINVVSSEGEGTSVMVTLPMALDAPVEREAVPERVPRLKLRILVIDDMEPLLMLLEDGLTQHGHMVYTALSGADGLQIFQRNEVDLIISDLGMPEMNGWDVGRIIRDMCEEKQVPKPPFIMLTGWGGQLAEKQKISDSGVDAIVEKPIDIPILLKIIRGLMLGAPSVRYT